MEKEARAGTLGPRVVASTDTEASARLGVREDGINYSYPG